MHEKNLASRLSQCQVILEVLQHIRRQGLIIQAGSSQTTIGFRITSLLLQGNEKHFRRMLLQKIDESRKYVCFPIDFLKLYAMIYT